MSVAKPTFVVVNLLYLIAVGLIVVQATSFTGEDGLVSLVIGVPTLGMLLVTLASEFVRAGRRGAAAEEVPPDAAPWSAALPVIGWTALLFLSILLIGFKISTPLYTFLFLKLYGKVSWVTSAIVAAALWLLVYVSFDLLLLKPLFEGIFFGAVLPLL